MLVRKLSTGVRTAVAEDGLSRTATERPIVALPLEHGEWRMNSDDTGYYRRRAEQEREAARNAGSKHIAQIHLELARAYEVSAEHYEPRTHLRAVA